MSTKVHTSAGNGGLLGGHPTDKFNVHGTDLGFLFEGNKKKAPNGRSSLWVGGLFGDTFNKADPLAPNPAGGLKWRSPVMGRTSNTDFRDVGIKWDNFAGAGPNGGVAKEIYPYRHVGSAGRFQSGNFDSFTIIPNDAIQVPDGRYFGMGFRVKDWNHSPTQAMAHTISNAWFWSDEENAETWQLGRFAKNLSMLYEWGANENRNAYFQNASFLMMPNDNHLYVFGSREGRKIGTGAEADGVYLRRAHYDQCFAHDTWEYWGFTGGRWQWGKNVQPTPILRPLTPGGWIGELNVQHIGGKVVLMYSDMVAGAVALTADTPDGVWSDPVVTVGRVAQPAQYAPSAHPWNDDLNDAYFHLSSWKQIPNPLTGKNTSLDYCTYGYRASLIAEESPQARALNHESETLSVDTSVMGPEDASAYLSRVAAASAEVGNRTD